MLFATAHVSGPGSSFFSPESSLENGVPRALCVTGFTEYASARMSPRVSASCVSKPPGRSTSRNAGFAVADTFTVMVDR